MEKERTRTFADTVYEEIAGAMTMGMTYIGVHNGMFQAMSGKGALTSDEGVKGGEIIRPSVPAFVRSPFYG